MAWGHPKVVGVYKQECSACMVQKVGMEYVGVCYCFCLARAVSNQMARVAVWLPGLPAPYDGTSIESIASYVKDVSEFLSSPLTRLVCQCHPNHIALLSGPSIIPPRGVFSSWWSYFDAIGVNEKHMLNGRPGLSIASNGAPDLDPLKQLVSAGTLPDGELACRSIH